MKIRFAIASLALATTALLPTAVADDAASLDGRATVEAKLDAKSKKLTLTVKGKGPVEHKGSKEDVYVNKDYPLKCNLKIKDGGKLDKAELKKDDAKFEDAGHAGKAKSATFTVGADKSVEGECKLVVCTVSRCSSPFKVSFTSN